MRNAILIVLLSLAVSGCYVQSLNVFYTNDAITAFPELTGEWKSEIQMGDSVTNKQITPWTFTTNSVETYDVDNTYSRLEVVYFKLGDTYFMDFTAGQPVKGKKEFGNFYWGAGITRVHSLCSLKIEKDKLTVIPLDLEWFIDRIKDGKLNIRYVKSTDKDSNYIFTATSDEWMTFLKKYGNSAVVFNPKHQFVFTRSN